MHRRTIEFGGFLKSKFQKISNKKPKKVGKISYTFVKYMS